MSNDDKNFEFEGKKYSIKKPTARVSSEASRRYSVEFTNCLKKDLMTKQQMKDFLSEHGVWSEDKDKEEKKISEQINKLELEIYRGGPNSKRMTLKEGQEKALEIKDLRGKYFALISERQSYEANTADALADNAKFDYLVSECVYNEDGSKVYNSYEDYQDKSNDDLAYEAASQLAQMMYSLEDDFTKKLPENQFLTKFGLLDGARPDALSP